MIFNVVYQRISFVVDVNYHFTFYSEEMAWFINTLV